MSKKEKESNLYRYHPLLLVVVIPLITSITAIILLPSFLLLSFSPFFRRPHSPSFIHNNNSPL